MLRWSTLFFVSIFALYVHADQQAILSNSEAEKTVEFLKSQDEIILFCGCCSANKPTKVVITSVSYECESSNWCKVRVQGKNAETQVEINKTIDLAYAWVNIEGIAQNLAWEMGLNADPCKRMFDWETYEEVQGNPDDLSKKEEATIEANFEKIKKILESNTGFQLKRCESDEQFTVEQVTVKWLNSSGSVVISYSGSAIEQRFTISMDKLAELHLNEEGLYIKSLEDGVIIVEELKDSKVKYRMFNWWCTVPVNTTDSVIEDHFNSIWKVFEEK